ncbi:NADPH quinone oxidoreductase protein [Nocardia brasiliensis ATCC 700358]|uniref:NADPH quinone oxidoreductase protein n=1 Tax=Nocardia brasiliensis (strain ATCC 700358 / HUJEG-1) TaxID=1133849 RepID=K0F071_NOCB7|nr:NADPH quinone oxidoreductase protein [Nocardia brasiliensis ATCC 700358]
MRIEVRAAGVHLIETAMREGLPIGPPLPELPAIFGGEVAGVIESAGPGVDGDWVGVPVVTSRSASGGYAELVVAEVLMLHRIPSELDFASAVAMIVTGTTTIEVLDIAELTTDDVVLVHSAAGGIGRLLVQHARNLGARVIGAAGGSAKVAAVAALGADSAVDYNEPGWVDEVRRAADVTVVLDGVQGEKGRAAIDLLSTGGRYLTYGNASRGTFAPDVEKLREQGITYIDALALLLAKPRQVRAEEERALAAAAQGHMVPAVQAFPLARAAAAHAALEQRATTGKVVLEP